eukprot:7382014-Prymnesium_polylepis.2
MTAASQPCCLSTRRLRALQPRRRPALPPPPRLRPPQTLRESLPLFAFCLWRRRQPSAAPRSQSATAAWRPSTDGERRAAGRERAQNRTCTAARRMTRARAACAPAARGCRG